MKKRILGLVILFVAATTLSASPWSRIKGWFSGKADSAVKEVEKVVDDVKDSVTTNVKKPSVSLTNADAVGALKEALNIGIKNASADLSAKNGYYGNPELKINLPKEADVLLDVIGKIPGGNETVEKVVLGLNRSAEATAGESKEIFINAIKEMTIVDGLKIVAGGETAATEYLKSKTYDDLVNLYRPKIEGTLDKPLLGNVSASSAWDTLVGGYNDVGEIPNKLARKTGRAQPFPPIEVDLATYATEKALDGLFVKIGEEEVKVRQDPSGYSSDLINKVFGAAKSGIGF